ncbi:toprim domain-containing protein [Frankia sp. RB7]|nr:toprim domain-containing protein [Frankia sp. RB7]
MIDLRTRQGWEDLKRILDDRISEVLSLCNLDMPRRNGWTLVDDPRGAGSKCFGLCLRADGLAWKKFNGTEKGRALELVAYCYGWYDMDKRGADPAARFVMERLGLGRVSEEQLARDRASAKEKRAQAERDNHQRRDRKAAAAFAAFAGAKPIIGTPADLYLRDARGIDLSAAPFVGPRNGNIAPGSLRFAPSQRYLRRDRQNNVVGEYAGPCMIACCTDAAGQIRAIHQTWIQPDGSDKAAIAPAPDGTTQPARKVLGEFAGLVIPLWRGEGHFSVKDAEKHGLLQTLILTEGVEDGLSAILAAPQHRVWAMISLSNMVNVAARLPACVDSVIVHRQNDWDKLSAVAAFDRGLKALEASGRAVAEVRATHGKDLNDTLRGAA